MENALSSDERKDLEGALEEIAEHCSYRERLAADAERESIKLKQVRMMLKHLGEEFDGKIVGMVESGLGRAANVALAALPGFTLPGDVSASDRFYRVDLTEPFVMHDGALAVPGDPERDDALAAPVGPRADRVGAEQGFTEADTAPIALVPPTPRPTESDPDSTATADLGPRRPRPLPPID